MNSLFSSEPHYFDLPNAEIIYFPSFIPKIEADDLFNTLITGTPWQQDSIMVYGKRHLQPRLTALYGNQAKSYSYSGITMQPHLWTPTLQKLRSQVEKISETHFSTVLLNYYRNGKDSNGWHADNEKELGINPIIASLSLGSERNFQLKHNNNPELKLNITLENGSLLLMKGSTQHFWKHQIPKTAKPVNPRINLTFRTIL